MSGPTLLHWFPAYRGQLCAQITCQAILDAGALNKQGIGYMPLWTDSSDLPRARNQALEKAIKDGFTWIVMQDSDIYCPSGSPLELLVETYHATGSAVVGAICGLRRIRKEQVAPNVRPFKPGKIYEAERVGTGLILIDVAQVATWGKTYEGPWFARTYHDKRQTDCDFGEDFYFSRVCNVNDGMITIDGRVETVHAYTDHVHLHYSPALEQQVDGEPIAGEATAAISRGI